MDLLIDAGKVFGRLTVLCRVFKEGVKKKVALLECQCSCGTVKVIRKTDLTMGKTLSCGCLKSELSKVKGQQNVVDLTNKVFGRLTVLWRVGSKNKSATWFCRCSCGAFKTIMATHLTKRHKATQSCGCLVNEGLSRRSKLQAGSLHPNWNSALSAEDRELISRPSSIIPWRNTVYERDVWTCQVCFDSAGGNLNAHHLDSYKEHPERRTDPDNGITLCTTCHKALHKQYGNKVTYEWQYQEFKQNYEDNLKEAA